MREPISGSARPSRASTRDLIFVLAEGMPVCYSMTMIKSLEEIVFVVEEAPKSGYAAKALGASIVTDSMARLRRRQ